MLVLLLPGLAPPGPAAPPRDSQGDAATTPGGHHLILLNIDLLRYDFVGLHNPERHCTPNIDRFFGGSVIFDEAQAPSGTTLTSNGAILTARERFRPPAPDRIRAGPVPPSPPRTLAHALADKGYRTININQGQYSGKRAGLDGGFHDYLEVPVHTLQEDALRPLLAVLGHRTAQPTFILYRSRALHYPYLYPEGRERIPGGAFSGFEATSDRQGFISFVIPLRKWIQLVPSSEGGSGEGGVLFQVHHLKSRAVLPFTRHHRDLVERTYCQQLRYVDEQLARVFALLEEHWTGDTIVLLYANHGEGLGDGGVFGHGCSYQACVHVPLLIRHPEWPGEVRVDTPVSLVDLAATLYDMLGVEGARPTTATGFAGLAHGEPYGREYLAGWDLQSKYLRWGEWKLIRFANGSRELYRLSNDPEERTDLHDLHPELAIRLEHELMQRELNLKTYRSRPD
jgi:arylsulfatase A-like enzyme